MKALIYYFFFNLITNSFALEFIKKDRDWYFSGPDCASLKNIAEEIKSWSEKVDKKSKIIPECMKVNSVYELNITEVLPQKVMSILKEGATYKNGHNCWNFALFSQGLVNSLRYTSEIEFKKTLEEVGICKKLDSEQIPMPGDIVALRVENKGLVTDLHTYVYLSDDIMMHKKGSLPDNPYELSIASKVDLKLKNGLEASCESCSFKKDIYRCDSIKRDKLYSKITPARDNLNEIECLQKSLNTLDQNIQNQFLIKSEALEILTALSLESAVNKLMENKDKTKEQEIEDEIRSWLHIKFQLNSIKAHH